MPKPQNTHRPPSDCRCSYHGRDLRLADWQLNHEPTQSTQPLGTTSHSSRLPRRPKELQDIAIQYPIRAEFTEDGNFPFGIFWASIAIGLIFAFIVALVAGWMLSGESFQQFVIGWLGMLANP